jgi:3-(3-hydroxy-phenyl)propionate hydroxylase
MNKPNNAKIIIVGCGPTGVVLANLLGNLGCEVAVLEKNPEVYPVPRANHIDEETIRNFQVTGLIEKLLPYTNTFGFADVVDAKGNILVEENLKEENSLHGFSGSRFFDQPAFEKVLREGFLRYENVKFYPGFETVKIEENDSGVKVTGEHFATKEKIETEGAFLVGCDGGRSFARLTGNIEMKSLAPRRNWLVVDTLLKNPLDSELLPGRFRYFLEDERLTIFAFGYGNNRRWEFQLAEGEPAPDEQTVKTWLKKYIDPERLTIIRITNYSHNSLVADSWKTGRIILAGDAAHMMPPSAGQGMCSGIRDAVNLAWKLALVSKGIAPEDLLNTYEQERKPHVTEILKGALFISKSLQGDNNFQKMWRNLNLKAIGAIPPLHELLRHFALRRQGLKEGFLDYDSKVYGSHFPQVKVKCLVNINDEEKLLDDLIGYSFALIASENVLSGEDISWAEKFNIKVLKPGTDFVDNSGIFGNWMRKNKLDYVFVRPDRVIFSACDKFHLEKAKKNFEKKMLAK